MSTEFFPAIGDDDEQADLEALAPVLSDGQERSPLDELVAEVARSNVEMIRHGRNGDYYQYLTLIDPNTLERCKELRQPLGDELNRAMLEQVYTDSEVLAGRPRELNKTSEEMAEYNMFRTDRYGDDICEHLFILEDEHTFCVSVIYPIWSWRREEVDQY